MGGDQGYSASMLYKRSLVACVFTIVVFSSAALWAQEPTPSEKLALEAYRQGSFGKAVQLYTTALAETTDPDHHALLHVRIAWTLFALGREDEVDTHLKAALLQDPDHTLVTDYYTDEFVELFEQARSQAFVSSQTPVSRPLLPSEIEETISNIENQLVTGSDLEGALADVDGLLVSYPQEARLVPLRIRLLELLGRQEEANELRASLGATGELATPVVRVLSIPELILGANRKLDEGDIDGSLALLREAVARQPSNVAALELMAEAAQRGARWQEASFALKSALALQPDNLGLRLRLGEVSLAMNDNSAARDVFRELTQVFPHSDRAWAALGLLHARLGLADRALEDLGKALAENPLLPEVQLARGELLLAKGEVDAAIAALRSASNLLQDDPQVEARLGQAMLAIGNDSQALSHLRAATQGGFSPPDVQRSLTLALLANGILSEARRVLDGTEPAANGDVEILRGLLLIAKDDLDAAETVLSGVAPTRPSDPALLNLLAITHYRNARYQEAVTLLARAHEADPEAAMLETNLTRARAADAAVRLGQAAQPVKAAPAK